MDEEAVDVVVADYLESRFDGYDDDFDDDSDDSMELEDDETYIDRSWVYTLPQIPDSPRQCSLCLDERNDLTFMTPCQHRVCRGCQERAFRLAIENEELYPPGCCTITKFSIELAAQALNAQDSQVYRERVEEMQASERLYCAVPTCSKFIPSTAIDNQHGTCPQCGQRTHTACKTLEHPGQNCPADVDVNDVLQLADEEGWQSCSRCGNVIERTAGCNHMRCRCGYQFCWGCGNAMRQCSCMAASRMDRA